MRKIDHFYVYRCHGCDTLFRDTGDRGGNTFRAVRWSDGWLDAPMLPQYAPASLCPTCSVPLWRNALLPIGTLHFGDRWCGDHYVPEYHPMADPAWIDAPHIRRPTLEDLRRAADAFAATNRAAERETRMWIWWRDNDVYRDPQVPWIPLLRRDVEAIASTERLRALLKPTRKAWQRLMLAELYREAEDFEACARILAGAMLSRSMTESEMAWRRVVMQRESRLVPVPEPECPMS